MKKILWVIIVLIVIAISTITTLLFQRNTSTLVGKPLKIGFMGPLSGDASSYGFSILKGVQLAQKELNASEIEIVTEDSKCDKTEAVVAIEKLIAQNVVAIIGETCSGPTLSVVPIAEKNKLVLVSPSATSPDLSGKSKFFFRTAPSDAMQGIYAANVIFNQGLRNLAIMHTNEEYGTSFANVLSKEFIKLGGKIVDSIAFKADTIQFTSLLSQLKPLNPDSIYVISNSPTSAIALLQQRKKIGLTDNVFGSEGLGNKVILKDTGSAIEGFTVTTISNGTKEFLNAYKTEYGVEATTYAAQGYDAFKTIYLAIQKNAKNNEDIAKNIAQLEFDGVTGKIKFDTNGDITANYQALKAQGLKFIPVSQK